MKEKPISIILAGGEGKRMKSDKPKALCEILFKPMLEWVIDAVKESDIDDICVVKGFKGEYIEEFLSTLSFEISTVYQSERLGTGHAVMTAKGFLENHINSDVLVLCGDAPFIDTETIKNSYQYHIENNMGCTVVSSKIENPKGYGRIVRNNDNSLNCIVEEKEATDEQRKINEVNSGVYWFNIKALINSFKSLVPSQKTGEYYLTDTIEIIRNNGLNVGAYKAKNSNAVYGANDCIQLNALCEIARKDILQKHMSNGVNIPCTDGVIIGKDVKIDSMTTILPSSILIGNTNVGKRCIIGPSVLIDNCRIDNDANISITTIKNQII